MSVSFDQIKDDVIVTSIVLRVGAPVPIIKITQPLLNVSLA